MSKPESNTAKWGITIGEIAAAIEWRDRHAAHVGKLIRSSEGLGATYSSYPPSGSDCLHPELWRAPHWRWLETVSNG
jgi:hypothetical protein